MPRRGQHNKLRLFPSGRPCLLNKLQKNVRIWDIFVVIPKGDVAKAGLSNKFLYQRHKKMGMIRFAPLAFLCDPIRFRCGPCINLRSITSRKFMGNNC